MVMGSLFSIPHVLALSGWVNRCSEGQLSDLKRTSDDPEQTLDGTDGSLVPTWKVGTGEPQF